MPERRRLLATFMVTNTVDAGGGSLRQAIMSANLFGEKMIHGNEESLIS